MNRSLFSSSRGKAFFIGLACLIVLQFAAAAQTWTYDFGNGTDEFNTPGSSTSFLPQAARGTARVSLANDGSFSLVNPGTSLGTNTELQVFSSSTSSPNKFGIYGYPDGNTAYIKFNMRFTRNRAGSWYFYLGSGNTFSNDETVDPGEVFTGLRWSFDLSGAVTASVHQSSGWNDLPAGTFVQSADYNVEIYANNSGQPAMYDKNGVYGLAPNTTDIWVNNVMVVDDAPKLAINDLSGIDSWMFYGQNGNSTAMIILDDIQYANFIGIKLLPVHFTGLRATASASGTELHWENGTESSLRQYIVERSEDGSHFRPVGTILPQHNDGGPAAYQFTDAPAAGTIYYRIQAVDQSGKSWYSQVLRLGKSNSAGLSVYPNPVTDHRLQLTLAGLPEGRYTLHLYNVSQKEAVRKDLNYSGGTQAQTIELPALPRGMYYLALTKGAYKYYQPLIIE